MASHDGEYAGATLEWDRLFAEQEAEGLDNLLDLFGGEEQGNHAVSTDTPEDNDDQVAISMLPQDAQAVTKDIIASAQSKSGSLNKACPNWRENICFAMKQDDPLAIEEALANVRRSRQRMLNLKQEILMAWERQNAGLEFFETALQASAGLSAAKRNNQNDEEGNGGFLSQQDNVHNDEMEDETSESISYG